ncbi:sugar phosphate isomerase/epimerase [Verrucomicrobiaceae bacterium N1E253]|uniref:Sugar phosphate isomerase/epimerase n=1 Tax=Oceaniferula marina TaxID=2748318 RepID=A0A851GJN8_9BACT|nr:sugar phosphate isomerase/epimerase family protein [Oceaniferula marina]NWK57379.1 sugar phosphate isomerase/epimerase [Oceaniferula marina]
MIIGCFALVEPFTSFERQLEAIKAMGIDYVDLTDSHEGGSLGVEYGFSASMSLDSHPANIREMLASHGLTATSVCAHANLLDPESPDRFGTCQIIKAIRLAHLLGIKQVITTEGDPKTDFGKGLDEEQMLLMCASKLYEPIRWARELGVELLLEPHGILTDRLETMVRLLDVLGNEDVVGVNLDTGNSWLGGGDPLCFVKTLGDRIKHVHWKDMGSEWLAQRGAVYGCGMGNIPLGDGIVGIPSIVEELDRIGFDGPTTLEVAGTENILESVQRLQSWSS